MSKISDMYAQIKAQQHLLVKTKLQEAIRARKEQRQLSEEEREDYKFSDEEVAILIDLLKAQGFEDKKDFLKLYEAGYPDEPSYTMLTIKTKEGLIPILVSNWSEIKTIPDIASRDDIESELQEFFSDDIEETIQKMNDLNEIDIEQLQVGIPQTIVREEKVEGNLIDKLKLIEKADDIDSIPANLFTDTEIESLIEALKDKENFVTFTVDDYTISDDFEQVSSKIEEYSAFKLKDKIVKIVKGYKGDIDLSIQTPEKFFTELAYIQEGAYGAEIVDEEEYDFNLIDKGITIEAIEEAIKNNEEIKLTDLAYDLDSHKVINIKEQEIKIDNVSFASLGEVIEHAIRGELIDTTVNAQYDEYDNYYTAGEYSDMPGEEEIAKILNSIDREILSEYFKKYPEDMALFEEMKGKYPDILGLDGEIEKPKDARQLFEESLLREDVVEYYLSKTPKELEAEFGTEVSRMVGFEQKNAHHCYDLWQHTLHTVASIDTTGLTEEQARKLKVSAFFHDIGKPDVVGFNPRTNQQNFINHAVHSVDIARPVLENLGYSPEEIQQISFYIAHHDDFLNYKGKVADKDRSHIFFRETSPSTVAEIVVQNQIDWEKLGIECYLPTHTGNEGIDTRNASTNNANNIRKRYICSALANGVEPSFRDFKNQPVNVDVDMEDIKTKLATGEYSTEYIPTEEDYRLLLEICKADARAQSEEVITFDPRTKQEVVSDTRERKVATMQSIGDVIALAYREGTDKISEATKKEIEEITGYSFEQFIKDSIPQALGEKRPVVICKDGTEYSIQASSFHACSPKKDGLEAYDEFEIYALENWDNLEDFMNYDGVAGNVPLAVVEQILKAHGGLDSEKMMARIKEQRGVYKPKSEAYEKMVREASGGNEYLERMLRYATRRVEVRGTEEKAKQLSEEYEGQLPKNPHSLDENN